MKCESFAHRFSQTRKCFSIRNFYEPRNVDQFPKLMLLKRKSAVIWQIREIFHKYFMMEIFESIHLVEISRLVEIFDAQKFSGLWKPMYEAFTFHLSFDCRMLRKQNALIFTGAHGKCVPNKGSGASLMHQLQNIFCLYHWDMDQDGKDSTNFWCQMVIGGRFGDIARLRLFQKRRAKTASTACGSSSETTLVSETGRHYRNL